jgi:eukaryotic-like serine/threonine-protein kinase
MEDAAQSLLTLDLEGGWKVIEKIDKVPGQTGSFFSVCYKIKRNKEICFLKAFDFSKFKEIAESGKKVVDIMTDMLNAHRYERDLSVLCEEKHLDKVVTVKEAGEVVVPGHAYPIVPYLIFELADGDIRKMMSFSDELDIVWKLHSLHSIAVGIKQLHSINVAHQDLKPSNVLVFGEQSKIADIGRSQCKTLSSPYDSLSFTGDLNYAPPEILYDAYDPDWATRTFATDCYLLGSMIVFYFAGISMTALIRSYLPNKFSWDMWNGSFEEVKDYLLDSFQKALDEFATTIKNEELKKELTLLVSQLCNPFSEQRGHPKDAHIISNKYNLERFITRLDVLYRKSKFQLIK